MSKAAGRQLSGQFGSSLVKVYEPCHVSETTCQWGAMSGALISVWGLPNGARVKVTDDELVLAYKVGEGTRAYRQLTYTS